MSDISIKIDNIIDRRIGRNGFEGKGHLDVIKKKKEFFTSLHETLLNYQALHGTIMRDIEQNEGAYFDLSIEDPTFAQKIELANPQQVLSQLEACIAECNRLEKRFNRETINISVVGRARQGKSRLLQSISGLPNEIIPADDGGDCTGAKSIITNSNEPIRAIVSFYSEAEIINAVNDYLKALNTGLVIGRLAQIPSIDLASIDKSIKTGADKSSLFGHLKKYVQFFDSYSSHLGTTLSITEPSEIRRYTSQYLNNNEKTYEYLGVKEVRIFTRFNYPEAGKIQLVDTIGLFDTALGLEKKMMSTLSDDSDAAILLRLPNPMGDHVDEHDNTLYNNIEKAMGQKNLNKWLFYVLNVWDANTKSGEYMFAQLNEQLGKTLRAYFVKMVDCASKKDVVSEILIPILEALSTNLVEIDNELMLTAQDMFTECHSAYVVLCKNISNALNSNFKQSLKSGGMFDQLFSNDLNLARRLDELTSKYSDRHRECIVIKDEIKKVLRSLRKLCPTTEVILEKLSRGDATAHPQVVYHNLADYTRSAISDMFEEINNSVISSLQEDVKIEISEVLRSKDGGKLGLIPTSTDNDEPNALEWLNAFVNQHLQEYPILKKAFENILRYRLNIEGSLEYKVSCSLEVLEPDSPKFEHHVFEGDKETIANEIQQAILQAIPIIGETLINSISEFLEMPDNLFYAQIKKLRERIIFSIDGQRELKELYRDKASYIWNEQFKKVVSKQVALEPLYEVHDQLSQQMAKSLFAIKIDNVIS